MGFLKDYNNASGEWKEAVKYIYAAVKRKKMYFEYKASFLPPKAFAYRPYLRRSVPYFYFNTKEGEMVYKGRKKVIYDNFPFFRVHKFMLDILSATNITNGSMIYPSIKYGFPQEYFTDKYKGKKLPIKDRTFSLIFGLITSFIICVSQILLFYFFLPEALVTFLILSISFTLLAMIILSLFNLAYSNHEYI